MKRLVTFVLMLMSAMLLSNNNFVSAASDSKILVAYFSRTGEEYGVGNVTKGNTHIVADMIAKATNADVFEIKPVKPYPINYDECTKMASREKATNARPEIVGKVDNISQYDTIFLGYPIWWGNMPMPVHTFLDSYDLSGKKIIMFCTHGGSQFGGTEQELILACPNSQIIRGFEVTGVMAQKHPEQVEPKVVDWLKKIGMIQ